MTEKLRLERLDRASRAVTCYHGLQEYWTNPERTESGREHRKPFVDAQAANAVEKLGFWQAIVRELTPSR